MSLPSVIHLPVPFNTAALSDIVVFLRPIQTNLLSSANRLSSVILAFISNRVSAWFRYIGDRLPQQLEKESVLALQNFAKAITRRLEKMGVADEAFVRPQEPHTAEASVSLCVCAKFCPSCTFACERKNWGVEHVHNVMLL